jgi:hypothetical protein
MVRYGVVHIDEQQTTVIFNFSFICIQQKQSISFAFEDVCVVFGLVWLGLFHALSISPSNRF